MPITLTVYLPFQPPVVLEELVMPKGDIEKIVRFLQREKVIAPNFDNTIQLVSLQCILADESVGYEFDKAC